MASEVVINKNHQQNQLTEVELTSLENFVKNLSPKLEKRQVVNFVPEPQNYYQSLKSSKNYSISESPVQEFQTSQNNPFYLNSYLFPLPTVQNVHGTSSSTCKEPSSNTGEIVSSSSLHSLDNVVASQNSTLGYHGYYNAQSFITLPSNELGQKVGQSLLPIIHERCICARDDLGNRLGCSSEMPTSAFGSRFYLAKKLMPPSLTWIGVLWTLISVTLAFLSAFSIISSTWVLQFADSDQNGFGPMKSCQLTVEDNLYFVQHCSYFVLDNGVMNWPSSPFQVTALLYSVGTFFLLIASIFAFSSLLTLSVWRQRTSWLAGYFQLSAVLVQSFALAIFPMGFRSVFVRNMCGPNVSMYNMGNCHLGWGYVLAIVTTSLVIFCPFLSKFSTKRSTKRCLRSTQFTNQTNSGYAVSSSQCSNVPISLSTGCV